MSRRLGGRLATTRSREPAASCCRRRPPTTTALPWPSLASWGGPDPMNLRGLVHRLRVWIAPTSYAREVDAEIHFHLELDAMHARGDGLDDDDAAWAARKQFGNVTHVR